MRRHYPDDTVRLAKLMQAGGQSGAEIARELEVPYQTVAAWLNRNARKKVALTWEVRNGEDK